MNPANKGLIFDIGTHIGEDARYFISKGYNVVAVDADPEIIQANKDRFDKDGLLNEVTFLNRAISECDGSRIDFYVNQSSAQNSAIESVGMRRDGISKVISVETSSLRALMEQYGVPFYCKVDIEGFDAVAVRSMKGTRELPVFTSAETECKPDDRKMEEEGVLDVLDALHEVGYQKFKLVDQATLSVLNEDSFYPEKVTLPYKMARKLEKMTGRYSRTRTNKLRLAKAHAYPFASDATGPFGEELEGEWFGYDEARKLYLKHRREFFSVAHNRRYSFWADWHATR